MDCLFSQNPFLFQKLYVNHKKFNLIEWRKQFNLFNETTINNLNYYNSRGNIPLDLFKSTEDIYKVILHNKSVVEKLNYKPNQYHDDAIYIINKKILIDKDNFTYIINYGYFNDYIDSLNKKSHSSWSINYGSLDDENYIDFIIRIYQNYELIINGEYENILKIL